MSESTSVPPKSSSDMKEKHVKLSPTSASPSFHLFGDDDEFDHPKYNPPMKHKESLQVTSPDSAFPVSPYVCPEPFWGSYGVSATIGSTQPSTSSPPLHSSPTRTSAGSMSNESHSTRQHTPAQSTTTYGSHDSAPILIAPNPSSLRGAVKQEKIPYRQNSLHSDHSTPRSQGPPQGPFLGSMGSLPSSGRKRKSPEAGQEGDFIFSNANDLSYEDHLLLQLTEQDEGLSWKQVATKFNEKTGKSMKVPALQMRKKRLIERLRVWTDTEVVPRLHSARCYSPPTIKKAPTNFIQERALIFAWEEYERSKWIVIANEMLKHGCTDKWTKEAVQRKWSEMHHIELSQFSENGQGRKRICQQACSDDGHSLYENDTGSMASAVSTVTMDEVRSRSMSDLSSQMQFHRQQQAQMLFQERSRQQRYSWNSQ